MTFEAYVAVNKIDLEVAIANDTILEWYPNLEELRAEHGEDAEWSKIELVDVEIEGLFGFKDIGMN